MQSADDDDLPELEDFSDKQDFVNLELGQEKQVKPVSQSIVQETSKDKDNGFKGLRKGFLNQEKNTNIEGEQKNSQFDVVKSSKKNPLEFEEVQKNMNAEPNNINQFLNSNQSKWLNETLIDKIKTNPNLQKLFSNPEYMNAIQQMQSRPKEVMEKYRENIEFVTLFQEFAKVMGGHFQNISETNDEKSDQVGRPEKLEKIKEVSKKTKSQEEIVQDIIANDPEVVAILQEKDVQLFLKHLQSSGGADFRSILSKDPKLGQKIAILIKKGILNVQN